MDNPLFDPQIDVPPPRSVAARSAGLAAPAKPDPKAPVVGKKKAAPVTATKPGSLSAWFAGLSLANTMGLGLAAGFLISVPLVLAFTSRAEPSRRVSPPVALRPRLPLAPLPSAAVPSPPATVAPVTPPSRDRVGLAAVMDGARWTVSADDWRRTGLPDSRLIAAVFSVLGELRLASGDASLTLPLAFGEVPPAAQVDGLPGGWKKELGEAFLVAAGPKPPGKSWPAPPAALHKYLRMTRAILIAHGDVIVNEARESVIIATGSVDIGLSYRSAVFAGRGITDARDAESLLVAGSRLSVTHPNWPDLGWRAGVGRPVGNGMLPKPPDRRLAVHAAPEYDFFLPIMDKDAVVAVNVAQYKGPPSTGPRRVDWPSLDLTDESRSPDNPLKENIALVATSTHDSYHGAVYIRIRGFSRMVKIVGSGPIVDAGGHPIPGVEGWSVYRIEQDHSMLCNGDRLVRVEHWKSQADPFKSSGRFWDVASGH
jgi:hypothetical protein